MTKTRSTRRFAFAAAAMATLAMPANEQPASDAFSNPETPFGLSKRMSVREVLKLAVLWGDSTNTWDSTSARVYYATPVPNPHPAFEHYLLVVGGKEGLCLVVGVGRPINTISNGQMLEKQFHLLQTELSATFGTGHPPEHAPDDSVAGQRPGLITLWKRDARSAWPRALAEVRLDTQVRSSTQRSVDLKFAFIDAGRCMGSARKEP